MTEHQSSRTLVKSAPELWAECSDAASLARHLGAFGEIRITRLEPETAVAWEGAAASGTVQLETSGWGTRVTLTVREEAQSAPPEPEVTAPPEPEVTVEPEVVTEPEAEPEPVAIEPEPEPEREPREPEPEPVADAPEAVPRRGMFARLRLFRRKPAPGLEPEAEPAAVMEYVSEAGPAPEPEPAPQREPALEPEPGPVAEAPPEAEPEPDRVSGPEPAPEPPRLAGEEALVAALDSLGMAHHRPYSRA
jgi:hypothetical protein